METMKSEWGASRLEVQVFAPNEFVASCKGYDDAFYAKCRTSSALIFFDAGNTNGKYVSDANRGGCGLGHTFRASDGVDLTDLRQGNCWLLLDLRTRQPGTVTITRNNVRTYFSSYPSYGSNNWENGGGFVLKEEYDSLLVRGDYNPSTLDGHWLVTDELQKIVPAS